MQAWRLSMSANTDRGEQLDLRCGLLDLRRCINLAHGLLQLIVRSLHALVQIVQTWILPVPLSSQECQPEEWSVLRVSACMPSPPRRQHRRHHRHQCCHHHHHHKPPPPAPLLVGHPLDDNHVHEAATTNNDDSN